jgi:hypothetical protein
MMVKQFNLEVEEQCLQSGIQLAGKDWYPLMKYDEEYGESRSFDAIDFVSVGLNPSLTDQFARKIREIILGPHHPNVDAMSCGATLQSHYFDNRDALTGKLIEFQRSLKYKPSELGKPNSQIPYFRSLDRFFENLRGANCFEHNVFHYDFCQLRCTNAKEVQPVIEKHYEMLESHFLKVLELTNPKIVFIFNAYLSNLLVNKNLFTRRCLDNDGCYYLKGNDGLMPKFILANQLTGGATSKAYSDLLIWHSKRIVDGAKA